MTTGLSPAIRSIVFGVGTIVMMAGAVFLPFGASRTALAAPLCAVEMSLPSGATAELLPGESALFSYSGVVTVTEVHRYDLQIFGGSGSGLTVDIEPQNASADVTPSSAPQSFTVSGRISVSVPSSAEPGEYTVGGLGAVATCTTRERDGSMTTTMGRDQAENISITVSSPVEPTPTLEPTATNTPVPPPPPPPPPPALCEPGLTLTGDGSLDASPGSQVSVPFEASIVVRRVSQVSLSVGSGDSGPLSIAIEPSENSFSFDPLPASTILRTFSGVVSITVPADQAPGSYNINDLVASANCQGVDQNGSATSLSGRSASTSITVRLADPTSTPEPSATDTAVPSSMPTGTPTATASATPTDSPTSTVTPSPTPTSTSVPAGTGTPAVTHGRTSTQETTSTRTPTVSPSSTSTSTSTATPSSDSTSTSTLTSTVTSTPRDSVRSPAVDGSATFEASPTVLSPSPAASSAGSPTAVAGVVVDGGSTTLDWTESREIFASARESRSYGEFILGAVAAALIAGGSYSAWRSRGGSTGAV